MSKIMEGLHLLMRPTIGIARAASPVRHFKDPSMPTDYRIVQYLLDASDDAQPALPMLDPLRPVPGSRAATDPVVIQAIAATAGLHLQLMLSLLPSTAQRPARVLELGTDPDGGLSAVLLAARYSNDWQPTYGVPPATVVSISHNRSVTQFARTMNGGRDRLQFHTGRLPDGWPADAPYDLIICHHVVTELPAAWENQCTPDGHLLMLADLLDRPGQRGFLALQLNDQRLTTLTMAIQDDPTNPHPWPELRRSSIEYRRLR